MLFKFGIALGALMILYGLFVSMAKAGTLFFLVWIFMGIVCIAAAIAGMNGVFDLVPRPLLYSMCGIAGLMAVVIIFNLGLIFSQFFSKGEEPVDVVIVLGAQVIDERPSIVLKRRLDTAVEYLKTHEGVECIVSGGKGSNEQYSEAHVMKKYLVDHGIDEKYITEESRSVDTGQNIANSKMLLSDDVERVGIITSNFHLYRGCAIAKKAGLPGVCGIAAPSSLPYLPTNIFRECLGIIKDKLAGNI